MNTLLQDLRYAARQLRRAPGFTVVAVLTLALGIGATTAMFSLLNAVLLRPLPVHEPDRLVSVAEVRDDGSVAMAFSYPHFQDYRAATGELIEVAAEGPREFAFNAGGEAETLFGSFVSSNYFEVLGIGAGRGRLLHPDDDAAARAAVVLSHDLWQRRFGGDPSLVGRTVRVNSQPLEVAGIAPAGFGGTFTGLNADLWVPIGLYPTLDPSAQPELKGRHVWLPVFGRLRPGVSESQASAALGTIARRIEPELSRSTATGVRLEPLTGVPSSMRTPVLGFLSLLLITALLVLVIGSVNVAGMLLARAATRQREMAIRLAIGAGRGRVVRQLLTESVLLFLLAATGGVVLAFWLTESLVSIRLPLPVQISLDLAPDGRVLAFALALALVTGVVFGLAPALQASRTSLADALKSGGRGQLTGRSRLRSVFVTGQIAMSLLLLIAAGLFVRALIEASTRDPGFNPEGVAVAAVDLEPHGYDQTTGAQFFRQLSERVAALPGVESVALAEAVPLGFSQHSTSVGIEGHAPASGEENVTINFNTVGAGYFETLQIPLLRGRGFGAGDQDGAPPVAVVNQAFAERYWPRDEPVGKRLRIGGEQLTVVGVTGTGRYNTLDEEPLPFLYLPVGQHYTPSMTVHLRSAAPAAPLLAQLQREVRAIDPNVPVGASMPLAQMIGLSLLPQRLAAVLIGGFAVLGLLLAAIGLYGIIAFSVAQRTREIGIRIALGAGAGAVRRLVVGQAGRLVIAGVVLGVLAAFGVTRLLASLLYGVAPADPLTFGAAALLLIAVALLASYFPARRATRVDPVVALRAE